MIYLGVGGEGEKAPFLYTKTKYNVFGITDKVIGIGLGERIPNPAITQKMYGNKQMNVRFREVLTNHIFY